MVDLKFALKESERQAEHCLERWEFYVTKSSASYKEEWARNYKNGAEIWAGIHELLLELKELRQQHEDNKSRVASE